MRQLPGLCYSSGWHAGSPVPWEDWGQAALLLSAHLLLVVINAYNALWRRSLCK